MPRILMIRHGKAAAGWDGHPDPGLDELGRRQAAAVADRLAGDGPVAILTSPLARARETAAPIADRWDLEPLVEPRVAEIPSPTQDLEARTAWLRRAMAGTWRDLEETYRDWRDEVVQCLASLEEDALVFSHFIAINAAVGHCRGEDGVVVFRPNHCSITTFEVEDGALRLVEQGSEAETEVR
jgi:broad specificity phosphatase PhoE